MFLMRGMRETELIAVVGIISFLKKLPQEKVSAKIRNPDKLACSHEQLFVSNLHFLILIAIH